MLTIQEIEKLDIKIAVENKARGTDYYLNIVGASGNSIFFENERRCFFMLKGNFKEDYIQIDLFFTLLDHINQFGGLK